MRARLPLGDGQGVPRLADVLALARGRIGVYAELKGAHTGTALGDLVTSGGAAGVEVLASDDPRVLRDVQP